MNRIILLTVILLFTSNLDAQRKSDEICNVSADGRMSATYQKGADPQAGKVIKYSLDIPFGTTPDWTGALQRQIGGMAWGDYDGDGDLDLAAGCYYSNSYPPIPNFEVMIYRNDGGVLGTTPAWISTDEKSTTDVKWADINGDGKIDLLAANGDNSFVPSVIYMNGAAGLSTSPSWTSSGTYWAVGSAFGDINGDGKLDLVLANQGNSSFPAKPICAFTNNNGAYSTSPDWLSGDQMITNSVAFGDLNNSDITEASATFVSGPGGAACQLPMIPIYKIDSVLVNGIPTNQYCFSKTDGFVSIGTRPRAGTPISIKYRYVKKGDIAVAKWVNYECALYPNISGTLNYLPNWTQGSTSGRKGVVWDDFDNDGFMDVVFGGSSNQHIMYKNVNGTLTGPVWTGTSVSPSTQELQSSDIDGDGYPELAAVHFGSKRIEIFKNRNGILDSTPTWLFVAAASATAIAFGDMNGDGGIDLAIGTAREPIVVFLNQSPPVPVELLNFSATLLHNSSVELRWETATETNNHGFSIERKVQEGKWLSIGFVSGKGTTTEKQRYQFIDITPSIGEAVYRLKQTDFDGSVHYSSSLSVVTARQAEFVLSQNFPNPFNPVTTIPVYIPNEEPFSLKVFDGLGGEVMTIFEGVSQRGGRNFSLNAGGLSSGIYYCALQTASARQVIPLLLQK